MNAGKRGLLGGGALIALVFAAGAFIGVGGMAVARQDVKEGAKPIAEWDIVDNPARVLKAGETFYEPTGCLHRVSKNPAAKGNTRVLAVVLHPRDAKQIKIPVPKE